MSGFLGQVLGGLMGGGQQGQQSPWIAILQQVLATRDGNSSGIAALVSRFEAAGLGQQAQSWVGNGENLPVSHEQIGQVFSEDQIDGWAKQAGTTPETVRKVLAEALPQAVDRLTPGGQIPTQHPDLSGVLMDLLGGAGRPRQT